MHITCVVGARPNFMKMAPILEAAQAASGIETLLVHSGQHYDTRMSELFFQELGMPRPDINLGVGGGSHTSQTANVMLGFEKVLDEWPTDMVLVVGDVNSTLGCALVAVKKNISVAHVEAGLRSGDRRMPEEINRILTDQISDYLFTTEWCAGENLEREGIPSDRIFFVGNVMIDSLIKHRELALRSDVLQRFGLQPHEYAVCTLHRPSNVDDPEAAAVTLEAVRILNARLPVLLPIHPRTHHKWSEFGILERLGSLPNVIVTEPLGYLDFLGAMSQARVVVTDSGGIQEETTVLGVPCLTFRENTERPITVSEGTNQLVGRSPERLGSLLDGLLDGAGPTGRIPELWDGGAAERIIKALTSSRS